MTRDAATPLRVVLVDDHPLLTHALAFTLRSRGVACTVPALSTSEALYRTVGTIRPDVVLLDLDLGPLGDGADLVPDLVRLAGLVLVVSASTDEVHVGRALLAGAAGAVSKDRPLDELVETVLRATDGEVPVMDPAVRHQAIARTRAALRRREVLHGALTSLSAREAHVLRSLVAGGSVRAIAADSHVSEATVRTQVRAILGKLDVSSQREAVAYAARAGWG